MTAPRDANAILGLLWPWGEIRRLRDQLAAAQYRVDAWRTAYDALRAEHIASLDRLSGPAETPGGLLGRHDPSAGIPVAAFGAEVAS